MTEFVLWGGPHDGLEVSIPSGHLQHIQPYRMGLPGAEQNLQALYLWSRDNKRFEWKEFA